MRPLEGILVLDFSQYLAGPSAATRLADLGARTIKIERPGAGDGSRRLMKGDLEIDGDSLLFHTINRNKEGFAANLKDPADLEQVRGLIRQADVLIQNFRPGVMERIGLDYANARRLNPRLVYGEVTGYGHIGPWREKPGQDLLAQSLSGMPWLQGNAGDPPVPVGLSQVDMMTGAYLVQGILACLLRRSVTGQGGLVQVSLLETALDMQFEVFTAYLNDGQLPVRSAILNSNPFVAAPYGIYPTADSYIALAMGSVVQLGELLGCPELLQYEDPRTWKTQRDEIKRILADHLRTRTTAHWLSILEPADFWCAEVLDWNQLRQTEGFQALQMVQEITRHGHRIQTTRHPVRIDGQLLTSSKGAPQLGEDTERLAQEFGLKQG